MLTNNLGCVEIYHKLQLLTTFQTLSSKHFHINTDYS